MFQPVFAFMIASLWVNLTLVFIPNVRLPEIQKRVQEMRMKLQQMNKMNNCTLVIESTVVAVKHLQNTPQFLNGLEGAVDRAGQPSGNILQRFDDNDYEEDKKQADQNHLHQTDFGVNSAIRSVLSEKMLQFGNYCVNFSVNDDDNAKCLYLEDQCEKLSSVDSADAKIAVEETVP